MLVALPCEENLIFLCVRGARSYRLCSIRIQSASPKILDELNKFNLVKPAFDARLYPFGNSIFCGPQTRCFGV